MEQTQHIEVEFDSISVKVTDAGQGWVDVEGAILLDGEVLLTLSPETLLKGDTYTIRLGCRATAPLIQLS